MTVQIRVARNMSIEAYDNRRLYNITGVLKVWFFKFPVFFVRVGLRTQVAKLAFWFLSRTESF